MKSNKRFSFVIPTYQNRNLVKNTLETLNRQEGFPIGDFEVIVVDDGSTDGTKDVINGMGKNYEFKYIYLERGPESTRSRARNVGVKASEGEFIIFIDGDILLKYDYLKELDKCFSLDNNIVVVGNRINLTEEISYEEIIKNKYYDNPKFELNEINKLELRHFEYIGFSYNAECQINPWMKVYSCNLAVPKKLLDKIGGFDENFKGWGLEDVELGYRLYKSGVKIVISNKIETFHQKHEKGGALAISQDRYQEVDRNTLYFIKKHPDAFEFPESVIVKLFRGQVSPDFNAIRGIRKKVVLNFSKIENLERIKDEIRNLSNQKSLKIVVNDYVESTDLDIWIQLLGKQSSIPLYYPISKHLNVKNVLGNKIIYLKVHFVRTKITSFVLNCYVKMFKKYIHLQAS